MDISEQINEIIDNTKNLALELKENNRMIELRKDLCNATEKALDFASKYIIKAMPVPDAIKDILIDVKDAIKTRDLKQVVNTVIKSTLREGMEVIGLSKTNINTVMELKNIASKGGLVTALKNGIENVAEKYLKNNIVEDYVYDFFNKLKGYIMNKEFGRNLDNVICRLYHKKDKFLEKCEEWYTAYKNMNLDKINDVASELNKNKYVLARYTECIKENNIIQNMTAMINNKKEALTIEQQRLCQVI